MKYLAHYEACGCSSRKNIPDKQKKQGACKDCKHMKWILGLGMEPYCKVHNFQVPNYWTQWCYDYKRKWWKVWK